MIIDAHQHVCWHGRNAAGLVSDLDDNGIDTAWLLTWEIGPGEQYQYFHRTFNPAHTNPDGTHPGITLSDTLAACDQYPERFVPGFCPHPALGNAADRFEAAWKMHGVRVCGEWKCAMLADDPRCIELFRRVGDLGCPVILHLDVPWLLDEQGQAIYQTAWYGGTIENLARAAEACPQTNFMGHAPGFWREISVTADRDSVAYPKGPVTAPGRLQKMLDEHENVYADLSGGSGLNALTRDADNAKEFLCQYADKLVYGRDNYGGGHQEFLATLDLPQDVQSKIYSENAEKLINL